MAENNHNLDGISAPVLEETTYDPSKSVKRSLDGIQAPTLEETSYTPEKKTAGLDDVAAPVLADTFTPNAAPQQYGAPQTGAPAFQQYGAQAPQTAAPQFQQYGAQNTQAAAPQFQQYGAQNAQATSQPFQQYGGAGQTSRNLDDVQKPVLSEEPQAEQRYVPKFVDPDLENAKKTAVDRAIKSSLNSVPDSFDEEKSREAYREFMREKEADLARKGGMLVIGIMVIGMISGLLTLLYSFMTLKDETPAFLETCNMCTMILGILFLGGAAAMLVKSNTTRKIASNIFTFGTILHVLPGLFVMFSKVQGTAKLMYLAVLVINIIICFSYGSSEAIKKHYNGHDNEAYY